MEPIIMGEARANVEIDLTEAQEAARVLSQDPMAIALTIGQQIAQHSVGMRRKFGRYPVADDAVPLPGHEDDEIIPFPDVSERARRQRALNRQDDRQRFRFWKLESFTKNNHERAGVSKHKHGLGSRGRRIRSVNRAATS